ncbi:class I SAM-dependent methyltransferase [Streptomyces sp. NPDC005526]|uniref:class I SAM-dependent methyltransferase n=1 Tax=Streptomyces sp. NPDC005526 TaxID=3156885 RepID=UPI0033A196C5
MSTAHDLAPSDASGRRARPAAAAWAADEPYSAALRTGHGPLFLRRTDGWLLPLEVERWCADPDPADLAVLARCEGAVLDVGCGPGRLVAALAAEGRHVLGIDVSEAAVAHTRRRVGRPPRGPGRERRDAAAASARGTEDATRSATREPRGDPGAGYAPHAPGTGTGQAPAPHAPGAEADDAARPSGTGGDASRPYPPGTEAGHGCVLRRSVFEAVPGAGCWGTALLMDGNVGIGGDPGALLRRLARLVRAGGLLIAETSPMDVDERVHVQVVGVPGARGDTGAPFPWARLGAAALLRHADRAGWRPVDQWTAGGRCFVALRSRRTNSSAEPPKSTAVISSQRARKPSTGSPAADW